MIPESALDSFTKIADKDTEMIPIIIGIYGLIGLFVISYSFKTLEQNANAFSQVVEKYSTN